MIRRCCCQRRSMLFSRCGESLHNRKKSRSCEANDRCAVSELKCSSSLASHPPLRLWSLIWRYVRVNWSDARIRNSNRQYSMVMDRLTFTNRYVIDRKTGNFVAVKRVINRTCTFLSIACLNIYYLPGNLWANAISWSSSLDSLDRILRELERLRWKCVVGISQGRSVLL